MYNSKEMTVDNDLTFISYNQTINKEFTVEEILESDLWITDYTPIFTDKGVTGEKNPNWYTSNMQSSTDETGTTVYNNNAYGAIYAYILNPTAYFDWKPPFTIELDVIAFNNANLLISNEDGQATVSFRDLGLSENNHLKVVNDGKVVRWFVDGVEKTELMQDISSKDCQIALRTGSSGGYIKYKNFCIHRNNILKAVPLFNCDSIVSANPNDKVLDDNRCIVLENITETLIQCISDDTGSIHYYSIELYAYAPYTSLGLIDEVTVYCIVYDEYLNTLNNVEVDVYVDNTFNSTITTDNQGIARFKVNTACTVKFVYGTIESNNIIVGSE